MVTTVINIVHHDHTPQWSHGKVYTTLDPQLAPHKYCH